MIMGSMALRGREKEKERGKGAGLRYHAGESLLDVRYCATFQMQAITMD